LYWDIGAATREKQAAQGWGDSVVERLSSDLKRAFAGTTGFSAINLWRIHQLHETYTAPSFLSQLMRETTAPARAAKGSPAAPSAKLAWTVTEMVVAIPWGHHVNMLAKIAHPSQRLYYLQATARFGWSRNVLLNQIRAQGYEQSLAEGKSHNFVVALPEHLAERAEEALKSSHSLQFLGIQKQVKERELEGRLIDLFSYHRFLKALVAVELKVGKFEPEYAGKHNGSRSCCFQCRLVTTTTRDLSPSAVGEHTVLVTASVAIVLAPFSATTGARTG
jgi:predicted nuclease of restriction endonuclease-like (RecB) superfamily